jgi:adenylate kinase family enzyme
MPVELVINLEVERETMKQRMFKRGVRNRRVDDTMEVIERRIAIYCDNIEPVLAHYDQQNKLHSVHIAALNITYLMSTSAVTLLCMFYNKFHLKLVF